jgi:hypothetical protein
LLVNPYLRSIPHDYLTNYIHATQKALRPKVISYPLSIALGGR